jgi:hypothetical protein
MNTEILRGCPPRIFIQVERRQELHAVAAALPTGAHAKAGWRQRKTAQAILAGADIAPTAGERHQYMLGRRALHAASPAEIAAELGCCPETVRRVLRQYGRENRKRPVQRPSM